MLANSVGFLLILLSVCWPDLVATAPVRTSPQSQLVLTAMGETAAIAQAELSKIHSALDLLHGAVARIDTAQQQMRAQLDNQAEAVQESARLHDAMARALHKFTERLDTFDPDVHTASLQAEEDLDPEAEVIQGSGTTTLRPTTPS